MRNPAVRAGLIFGLIIGGVGAIYQGAQVVLFQSLGISSTGLSSPDPQASVQALPYLILFSGLGFTLFLVYLGLYLWCGAVASRKAGSVGTGSIAGLIAGAIAGLLDGAVGIVIAAFGLLTPSVSTTTTVAVPDVYTLTLIGAIFGAVLGLLFDVGLGAGVGALGGLIGKSTYDKAHPYPAMPGFPGMYQMYPWYGAYPPPPGNYPPPGTGPWPGAFPPPGTAPWSGAQPPSAASSPEQPLS